MIYGYDSKTLDEYGLKQMKEVSLGCSPSTVRELAKFLFEAADELEQAESIHWHKHAPERLQRQIGCDVIVINSKYKNR